jgi:hypothetical protein
MLPRTTIVANLGHQRLVEPATRHRDKVPSLLIKSLLLNTVTPVATCHSLFLSRRFRATPVSRNREGTNVEQEGASFDNEIHELRKEARALSLSLYRACLRSIKHIRGGNQQDEHEFSVRERARIESFSDLDVSSKRSEGGSASSPKSRNKGRSGGDGMINFLPPVNRLDELRSRADYYASFARENFLQEWDCLGSPESNTLPVAKVSAMTSPTSSGWNQQMVNRYINLLRRGNAHRQWLLSDLKFSDPIKAFSAEFCFINDTARLRQFEQRSLQIVNGRRGHASEKVPQEGHRDYQVDMQPFSSTNERPGPRENELVGNDTEAFFGSDDDEDQEEASLSVFKERSDRTKK